MGTNGRRCLRLAARHILLLLIGVALQGCLAAPKTATQARAATTGQQPIAEYWKSTEKPGEAIQLTTDGTRSRVVLTEFSIEFVTERFRGPLESQLSIKPPPFDPIGLIIEAIGPGRVHTPMGADEIVSLAAGLKAQFIHDLEHRGLDVVSQAVVREQSAYATLTAGLKDNGSVSSSPLLLLNPISSDVGVINATTTISAPHMRLIDRDLPDAKRQQCLNTLLQNVKGNVAVSIHLVVGCWRDRAAIEQNSQIGFVGIDGNHLTLKAAHSLVSDRTVNAPSYFVPLVGDVQPVRQAEFDAAACELLPEFIDPALEMALGISDRSTSLPAKQESRATP